MNAVLLTAIIIGVTLQHITKKAFNLKVTGGAYTFSAATALFALIFFVITSGFNFNFSSEFLVYSIAFSVSYSLGTVGSLLAVSTGPLSLTSLITSYSLIIPTLYGIFALNESVKLWLTIGIILLLISLIFVNLEKDKEDKKITLKWAIYAALAFIGNGACSTVQRVQQINCNGNYKNEFMIVALIISVITMFIIALFYEKNQVSLFLKKGFSTYSVCGLSNGIVNLLVIILSLKMSASLMFPIISAGGIIATVLVSIFIYKEKLSMYQKIGIVLGTLSIIFLNL